ncbi:MAG: glutathione S-transferase family protein [Deltaproteobacteria bacterium]|nr:glutathione S-transferase family protein [Deltaproteobacteria bacterium]
MSKIILYDNLLSQNSYKVKLALSQLQVDHEVRQVDLKGGEQKKEWFLKLNPNGQVPTLVDGDYAIWESNSILLYLGRKFAPNNLIPQDLQTLGKMLEWMMFEACKLSRYIGAARFLTRFMPKEKVNQDELSRTRKSAGGNLAVLNGHLAKNDYLAGSYTLADIACYGQICVAQEGALDLSAYPAIVNWMKRVESTPNFIKI